MPHKDIIWIEAYVALKPVYAFLSSTGTNTPPSEMEAFVLSADKKPDAPPACLVWKLQHLRFPKRILDFDKSNHRTFLVCLSPL